MKREIKFNSLYSSNNYTKNLEKLFADYELFRQKHFSNACLNLLNTTYPTSDLLLTHSATGALEMIALILDIREGDEIILPSFTFVSTANAFALRGAKLIFIDIELDTFGIDPLKVEGAITEKTKAIVGVHYAGNPCKIDQLKEIAGRHHLALIEDAAMSFGASLGEKSLGTFGDFGVLSFDVTKHVSATQGGCLIINNSKFKDKAYEVYHTGTNRTAFEDGEVSYYEWVSLGSKYQMPETNAAILQEQLAQQTTILNHLNQLSKRYCKVLTQFENEGFEIHKSLRTSKIYHEFFILLKNKSERDSLAKHLKNAGIEALFHYIPLHNASFAKEQLTQLELANTENISNRLLRLPMHTQMTTEDVDYICSTIKLKMEL